MNIFSLLLLIGLLHSQLSEACVPDPCDLCNSMQNCVNGECVNNDGSIPTPGPTPGPTTPAPTPPVSSSSSTTPVSTAKPSEATPTASVSTSVPTEPTSPGQQTPIEKLVSEADWNKIFPNRWYVSPLWKNEYSSSQPWYYPEMEIDYYSYRNFVDAVNHMASKGFERFANEPGASEEDKKRELCAFFGNIGHETGRGTDGLFYREELGYERTYGGGDGAYRSVGSRTDYVMGNKPVYFRPSTQLAGKVRFNSASYHGRGPLQLSWGYNYGDYSKSVYGDPQVLLEEPDRILDDPKLGISAAIWFWMTQPDWRMTHNPHNVMYKHTSSLQPWGFGRTIMAINGGLEANGQENGYGDADKKVTRRIQNYRRCAQHFNIRVGINNEQLDTVGFFN